MPFWLRTVLAVVFGTWPLTAGYVVVDRNALHVRFPTCFYVDVPLFFFVATGSGLNMCARADRRAEAREIVQNAKHEEWMRRFEGWDRVWPTEAAGHKD